MILNWFQDDSNAVHRSQCWRHSQLLLRLLKYTQKIHRSIMLRLNSTIVPHIWCYSFLLWLLHPGKWVPFAINWPIEYIMETLWSTSIWTKNQYWNIFIFQSLFLFVLLWLQWLMLQFTHIFQNYSIYPHHLQFDNKKLTWFFSSV